MRKLTVIVLVVALLAAVVPVFAGTENDGPVVGDTIFARPLGLAAIAGGAALWLVSLPFAVLTGSTQQTTETLISNPVRFTFQRPVGDFDYQPVISPKETGD